MSSDAVLIGILRVKVLNLKKTKVITVTVLKIEQFVLTMELKVADGMVNSYYF